MGTNAPSGKSLLMNLDATAPIISRPSLSITLGEPEKLNLVFRSLLVKLQITFKKSPCKIAPALGYLGRKKPVDSLDSEGLAGYGNRKNVFHRRGSTICSAVRPAAVDRLDRLSIALAIAL